MNIVFFRKTRLKRVLRYCSVVTIVLMLVLIAVVASLPALISLPVVQKQLKQTLTKSLKRSVDWSNLTMTWSGGGHIKSLSLGDGPPPLLSSTVDEISLTPLVSFDAQRRLKVDFALRVHAVKAAIAPGPAKPPKPYREPLTTLASALQKFAAMDRGLPIDVGVKVEVAPLLISYRDPAGSRELTLSDISLRLDMPSLASQPINAEIAGKLAVNGQTPELLNLKAEIKQLVTARRIHPAAAQFALAANLPGTTVTVAGGLLQPDGFRARGKLDLSRLLAAVKPLLKPSTPALAGLLDVELKAVATAAHDLQGTLAISGSGLALSGGKVKKGRLGPFDLHVQQKVVTDHVRQQVRFSDGSLTIPALLEAGWQATVTRPDRRDRTLEVAFGPAKLDLQRALITAGPMLPPKFTVRELTGELIVRSILARLDGRSKLGELQLEGVSVNLPHVQLALARGAVNATGVELAIDRATVPLQAMKPVRVDAGVTYGLGSATVGGSRPIAAERLRGNIQLAVNDIDLQSASPRRFTATATMTQAADLGRVQLDQRLAVTDLHQQLQLVARATKSGAIEATLSELKITAAALQATAARKNLPAFPLAAALTATGITLPAERGIMPTINGAACDINAGNFLQISAKADSPAASKRFIATKGTARLDLDHLLPLAAPFLPKGLDARGVTGLTWNLAAPFKKNPLPKEANKLRLARAAAALIEHGEVVLSLDNRNIALPSKRGRLEIGTLRTSLPLRLLLPAKGGNIRFEGGVDFTHLAGLVAAGSQLPPQDGSLLVKGDLLGWQTLRLHEELNLKPLGISQKLEGTISRLESLAEVKGALSAAILLQRLDADLSSRVAAGFPDQQAPFPGGLGLSGSCAADATVKLAAGKELQLRASLESRNLGVKLRNGTTVEGANADLLIDRTYTLAKGEVTAWTPLSVLLMHPAPVQRGVAGAVEIAGRVREDLRGQESGSRRFSVRRIRANARSIPLELTSLEGELLLTREQVGLSFLQTELLGGTLRASGVIDLRPELPSVAAACTFSNLETALLLPLEARKKRSTLDEDTTLSGEVSFEAPLVAQERELLEGLRLKLNLRKIGADTLERALFSLDPYERNEKLVAQRKLLRHGNLKRLSATTLDGAFSLEGEVLVKGVPVDLPEVERIRLAEMSIKKQMARTVAAVAKLRRVLDLVRADTLLIGPKGEVSLKYSGAKTEK